MASAPALGAGGSGFKSRLSDIYPLKVETLKVWYMMKWLVILVLSLIIIFSLFFIFGNKTKSLRTLEINNHKISVEIADTEKTREKGLSGRSNLTAKTGMLFVFKDSSYYQFWMNEMQFPLDFVWIDGDKIVDLSKDIPVYNKDNSLSIISSKYPFDKVLEINAGQIEALDIKIGDKVNLL